MVDFAFEMNRQAHHAHPYTPVERVDPAPGRPSCPLTPGDFNSWWTCHVSRETDAREKAVRSSDQFMCNRNAFHRVGSSGPTAPLKITEAYLVNAQHHNDCVTKHAAQRHPFLKRNASTVCDGTRGRRNHSETEHGFSLCGPPFVRRI